MSHPATEGQRGRAIARLLRRQVANRVFRRKGVVVEVAGTMLRVPAWSTSAGLVLYTGLSEYHPMQFMLRYLRSGDLFVDVGANVGVYSSFACSHGAEVVAFEPFPRALEEVRQNARLNGCTMRAEACAIAERNGTAHFQVSMPTARRASSRTAGLRCPSVPWTLRLGSSLRLSRSTWRGLSSAWFEVPSARSEAGTVLLVEVHRNLLGGSHKEFWEALAQMGYEIVDCERLEPVDAQVGTFVATADVQETRRRVAEKPALMPPVSVRLL